MAEIDSNLDSFEKFHAIAILKEMKASASESFLIYTS